MRDTITFGYDEAGNLASMNRSGTAADMTYIYDLLHGWVKQISSSGGFEQKLYREDNTGTKLFNGSISAMTWKEPGYSFLRRYNYTYDGINRLTEGRYYQLPIMNPVLLQGTGEELAGFGMEEESMPLGLIPVIDEPGNPILPNFNAADRYTERISYDRNSNITCIERYGMNDHHQYGKIDSLDIKYNGNQLKSIEDHAEKHLTYTGASDFYDGYTYTTEYGYNANGALDYDINRDIDLIQYDDLGNTRCIYYFGQNQIEYVYAADGTKLRTIHRPASSSALTDSIDYIGNLILKNGQPSMYIFDGGYASFGTNGAVDDWHYYIQDYMGNNRMVVNKNGTVEQVTHYYPYGGVIGDISTNENVQNYKFEGKELDRTFGLDNYDIHARQYFAMMPTWDRLDKKAEDYYPTSPYAYCGGNPVNYIDPNGFDTYKVDSIGMVSVERNDEPNTIIGTNPNGKSEAMAVNKGQTEVLEGIIDSQGSEDNKQSVTVSIQNSKMTKRQARNLFRFLARTSTVEWSVTSTNGKLQDNPNSYIFATDHNAGSVGVRVVDITRIRWHAHSHPAIDGTKGASGVTHPSPRITGDYNSAYELYKRAGLKHVEDFPQHLIYHRYTDTWYRYTPWRSYQVYF